MGLRSDTPTTDASPTGTVVADPPVVPEAMAPVAGPTEPTGPSGPRGPDHSDPFRLRGREAPQRLQISEWLFRSHAAGVLWLIVRIWLGYQWINAGYQKIWGSERAAFWYGNGAGVKGFATAGVAGSASGKGGASYGWWAGFLHNFVIPNASWIAKCISVAEILIGVAILLGFLTGAAAAAGLSLNVIYMFSGSAGVNPMYAILSVLLVLAWRNAGWFGLDRAVLPAWRRLRARGAHAAAPSAAVPSASGSTR